MLDYVKGWLGEGAKLFDRRGAPRVEVSPECFAAIDGRKFSLRNLSATGFLASPYDGDLKENRSFTVRIGIKQDHHSFMVDARAVVVRRDAGGLAARFMSMSGESQRQLDDYFNYCTMWLRVNR